VHVEDARSRRTGGQRRAGAGPRSSRRLGALGGTTSWEDCAVALRHLADRRHLVEGPAIAEYERVFADRIGVRYAYSFSAGRVGLYGILGAMGIGEGDEVLLQVPTHVVVANAIRYRGARPIYVDCRRDSFTIDVEELEQRITPRARAIVLQHTFGIPADVPQVLDLARRHGLRLIEDCVHALGAKQDGREVGSFGDAAFFSTEETKTISSTMGGMVVTDDPELADRLARFQAACDWTSASLTARYLLKLATYHVFSQPLLYRLARPIYERLGRRNPLPLAMTAEEERGDRPPHYEQRLSNGQAAVALRQLRRLETNLRHRRAIAAAYRERLAALGFAVPRVPPGAESALVRYPVWVRDREETLRTVTPHAVLGTWFTSVLEDSAAPPSSFAYEQGSCPVAEAAAVHLVNLPTHLRVELRDVDLIAAALAEAAAAEYSQAPGDR
jgi:perosamine synthetase